MLPKDWELRALEDICQNDAPITYGVLKPGEYYPEGIPLLQIKDMVNGGVSLNDLHRIPPSLDEEYKRSRICDDDILISLVGTIGRVAKVKGLGYANIHRNIGRVRSQYHDYLFHFLRSDVALHEMGATSSGSSQSALNLSTLRAMKIPFPPFAEQKKIAQILSTWDQAIATTERLLDLAHQQKKALMQQLLTGKKRFPGFEGEWRNLPLCKMAEVIVSPVDKKTEANEFAVELCNYTDVYYNHQITRKINFMRATATKAEIEKYTLQKGDVIITKDSETPGDIAVPALVSEDLSGVICGYHLAIIRPNNNCVDGSFLNYLFSMQKTRYYFFTLATGATRFGLSVGAINHAHFNIPSIDEQKKIASVLSATDQEIETLQSQLAGLKQEKKALMQQLLTGKVRVKVMENHE